MGEAVPIGRWHRSLRERSFAQEAKPPLARIALGSLSPFSQDAVDTHLDLSRLAEMPMVPGLHHHRLVCFVAAHPHLVGFPPGVRPTALKQRSVFARCPTVPFHRNRGWSIQLAIALESQQNLHLQPLTCQQKGSRRIPAIRQDASVRKQQRAQVFHLLNRDPYLYWLLGTSV